MQKGMYFQVGEIRGPGQRPGIVQEDVPYLSAALANDGERLDPSGGEGRCILLIEELTTDAVRVPLHGDGAVLEMGEDERRHLDVIVNDLGLRIAGGIERLGRIRMWMFRLSSGADCSIEWRERARRVAMSTF